MQLKILYPQILFLKWMFDWLYNAVGNDLDGLALKYKEWIFSPIIQNISNSIVQRIKLYF